MNKFIISIRIINLIFIISIIFYIINIYLKKPIYFDLNEKFNNKKSIEIIVSRYNETLEWTLIYPFNKYKYTVYNKGPNNNFEKSRVNKIIQLNNVGRNDHTYLYHIINNYNNLADINVFFTGSINLPHKKKYAILILNNIETYNNAIFISLPYRNYLYNIFKKFKLDEYICTDESNKKLNNEKKLLKSLDRPYGKWYKKHFSDIKTKCHIYGGIFSVSKNDILNRNIDFYKNIIKGLETHSNPEEGHYIERSWCSIFYPLKDTIIIIDK
jgi:hypothetical protein